jgi:F-type H+-transporting ATPase subunit delta
VIQSSVARRYAKALFETLDPAGVDPASNALTRLAEALATSTHLKHVLASPAFSQPQKLAILSSLVSRLDAPHAVTGLVAQLVGKTRVGLLPAIAEAFTTLADEARGNRRVSVTTARSLSSAEQQTLTARLRELLRQDLLISFETDPGLLSGLQLRIGSTVIDSSVRSRLAAMQVLLTKES